MKVLLIGEIFSNNLGDPIIYENVKSCLEYKFRDISITPLDLSCRIGKGLTFSSKKTLGALLVKIIYKIKKVFLERKPIKSVSFKIKFNQYFKYTIKNNYYDAFIFCGGSIFMDYFAYQIHHIIKLSPKKTKTIVFHSCGFGNLTKLGVRLLKKSLNSSRVSLVSLRDGEDIYNSLNINKPYFMIPDIAFCSPSLYEKSCIEKATVGIGLFDDPKALVIIADLIVNLNTRRIKWSLFSNGSFSDNEAIYQLGNILHISPDYLFNHTLIPNCPLELVNVITSFDKIVSFRLHSHIIAASYGIKSYGIIWSEKIRYFFHLIGNDNCCCSIDCYNYENVFAMLDKVIIDKKRIEKLAFDSKHFLISNLIRFFD